MGKHRKAQRNHKRIGSYYSIKSSIAKECFSFSFSVQGEANGDLRTLLKSMTQRRTKTFNGTSEHVNARFILHWCCNKPVKSNWRVHFLPLFARATTVFLFVHLCARLCICGVCAFVDKRMITKTGMSPTENYLKRKKRQTILISHSFANVSNKRN